MIKLVFYNATRGAILITELDLYQELRGEGE
jgi:hypothetical protein